MSYTLGQIKVLAFNKDPKDDFSIAENNLYCGLAYCYDWYRLHPEDKDDCERLMADYIFSFEQLRYLEQQKEGDQH